ncbi:MAG TPA: alginate lyase family protein, partial [Burkholderiales bacterium]
VPEPDLSRLGAKWIFPNENIDAAPYVTAAERAAMGRLDVFALADLDLGLPPRWNRDPKTGIEAPLRFGKTLDYRDPDLVGDIKYLWEPNRHLQLVTLAQAYALTRRRKYFDALVEQLDSWFLACPYGRGANWSSALEAGIRLVNWSAAWHLVGGHEALDADVRARWLKSVYQHARFVRHWFSSHSSANNHLLGEATGLYVAALTWPHWPEAADWLLTSRKILEREALRQVAPDGVSREQATWYQQFVLDMLLVALFAGRANGERFSPQFESRLEAMIDFIGCIMDAGGNVPMFGDADDGALLRLAPGAASPFRSALGLGALLFRRGDFKLKAGAIDDKARWLFGEEADRAFGALEPETTRLPLRQAFPDGGYYILGCGFDTPREVRAVVDAGPLGYTAIAAHGHADALSFTLSVHGREFLIDPGTYAYHTQPAWRGYFRGTSAHNTLRVDGVDQSEQGGNFLWLRKARAGCSLWLSTPEADSFEGWQDGYLRLADPVKHRRLVSFDKRLRRLVVEDRLEMQGSHDLELFFHCAEACSVDAAPGGFVLSRDGIAVRIALPPSGDSSLHRGELAPILGWVSRAFDRRAPTHTIAWRARLSGTALLRTEIQIAS